MACMALNILVGHTGLVSFGHGAWFGLAAYAAGLLQRNLFPGSASCCRSLLALAFVAVIAAAFGYADPAPARRLFLAADAGAVGDALRRSPSAGPR